VLAAHVHTRQACRQITASATCSSFNADLMPPLSRPDAALPYPAPCTSSVLPDPTIDLSVVEISRPPVVGLVGAPAGAEGEGPGGKYEATPNTLYIGGLPIEWSTDQVSCALLGGCRFALSVALACSPEPCK
jgi:hypothetical protein